MVDKFYFYSKSRDEPPGKGTNEHVKVPSQYEELKRVKDWRKMLSNFWVEPFTCEGKEWASVEHYYHAKKFPGFPAFQEQFTLGSGSKFSKDPAMAKSAGGKTGKCTIDGKKVQVRPKLVVADDRIWKKVNNDNAFKIGMFCKFTQSDKLKKVLLATGDAELWHIVSRGKPIRFTYLETVRGCIRNFSEHDLAEHSKHLRFKMV